MNSVSRAARIRRMLVSIGLGLAMVAAVAGALAYPRATQAAATGPIAVCKTGLIVGIGVGPNAGTDLSGDFELQVSKDQSFVGTLKPKNGGVISVTGQGAGHGIDMVFDLGGDKLAFAHGVMQSDVYNCKGLSGGTLTGPEHGDIGDWNNRPPFIRVISGTIK